MRAPCAVAQHALANIRVAAGDETMASRSTVMKTPVLSVMQEKHKSLIFLVQLGGLEPPTS
jgi:hypothetical protein